MFRIVKVEEGFIPEVQKGKKKRWCGVDDDGDTHKRHARKLQWAVVNTVEEAITILKTFYKPEIVVEWKSVDDIGYASHITVDEVAGRPKVNIEQVEYEYEPEPVMPDNVTVSEKLLPKYSSR